MMYNDANEVHLPKNTKIIDTKIDTIATKIATKIANETPPTSQHTHLLQGQIEYYYEDNQLIIITSKMSTSKRNIPDDERCFQNVKSQKAIPSTHEKHAIMKLCRSKQRPIPRQLYNQLSQCSKAKLHQYNPKLYPDYKFGKKYTKIVCAICLNKYSRTNRQRHFKSTVCQTAQKKAQE